MTSVSNRMGFGPATDQPSGNSQVGLPSSNLTFLKNDFQMNQNNKDTAILLIHCPDQKGIVASISDFLLKNNGNVVDIEQHVDQEINHFYMRVEWELNDFLIPKEKIEDSNSYQCRAFNKRSGFCLWSNRYVHHLLLITKRLQP